MTHISRDDVLHLARLSSLQLTDDEVDALQADIGSIITYIEQLSELDTHDVEPTYQVSDRKNIWRTDEVDTLGITREKLLTLAPDAQNSHVKVPKVL